MTSADKSKSFWATLPGSMTAFAGVVTAIATLIGALVAGGVLHHGKIPPSTNAVTPILTGTVPESTTKPSHAADRASIDLVYNCDRFGCLLQLNVQVGDQTVQPSGSRFTITDALVDPQKYTITGFITCISAGRCIATGSGVIDVADNQSYFVTWLNTAVGRCQVTLQQ